MKLVGYNSLESFLPVVTAVTGVSREQITAPGRGVQAVAWARQMWQTLLHEHTCLSWEEIGAWTGRDMNTARHAVGEARRCFELPDPVSRARARQYFQVSVAIQKQIEDENQTYRGPDSVLSAVAGRIARRWSELPV